MSTHALHALVGGKTSALKSIPSAFQVGDLAESAFAFYQTPLMNGSEIVAAKDHALKQED